MEKNNYEEFIKIDANNLYIDKKIISSLFFNANKFFQSFEDFRKDMSREFKIVNEKLDYLIGNKSQNDSDTTNRLAFCLNQKEKQPEDRKS